MVTHIAAMMLRHAKAESALESSRRTAWDGISLLPSEGFGPLLQHLDCRHRFVGVTRVSRRKARDVHQAVLHRVDAKGVRHLVNHVFPRPLGLLLDMAAGRTGTRRVRPVGAPRRSPVRNLRRIEFQLVKGVARAVGMHTEVQVTNADEYFVIYGYDAAVFLSPHAKIRDGLRFDLQLRQLLILGQHDLDGPARDFRQMGDHRIKSLRGHARCAESAAVPFVDEPNPRYIDAQRCRQRCARWIDALAHTPDRQPVAVPFRYAATRLHRNRNPSRKAVGELLDDIRFGKPSFELSALIRPSRMRKVFGRIWMSDQVTFSVTKIWRVRCHGVLQRRSEGKDFIVHADRAGGILGEVFGLRSYDSDHLSLQVQFLG